VLPRSALIDLFYFANTVVFPLFFGETQQY
jgi:hypothetical protein